MSEHSKDSPPIDFAGLNQALLGRISALLGEWLSDGKKEGHEWVCHSVWRVEKSASLKVAMEGERIGKWADFGGDHRGNDLVSLYAAIRGMSNGAAAVDLAHRYGLEREANVLKPRPDSMPPAPPPPPPQPAASKPVSEDHWRAQMPVPEYAPQPPFKHKHYPLDAIVHKAAFMVDGQLLGYVVRFKRSDGSKLPIPYTWCVSEKDGGGQWYWKFWSDPRPLYYPSGSHPGTRTVIVVEGELKADVLQQLLDARAPNVYCVVSWPGGSNSWKKASWQWLAGSTVLLWPDCDGKRIALTNKEKKEIGDIATDLEAAQAKKPYLAADKQAGMKAMLSVGALLRDSHACSVSLLTIPEPGQVEDGWDCRDAIETDGWDFERVLTFFASAQPLVAEPAEPSAAAAAAAGGSGGGDGKIARESPADAGDGDGDEKRPWWLRPYWDADKGRWLVSRKLVIAALTHDDALRDLLGLNLLSNNIEARKAWPWRYGKVGPITGAVDLLLGRYLSVTYGLPSINRAALSEAIETIAHENQFHPIREYLEALPEPRGRGLIDKWLLIIIGETPDTLSKPVFEYLSLVGRYWLLGMVNRVMDPGCQFDYCPVLEGKGGLRKTTMVKTLATVPWFGNTHFEIGRGKEGQEQVQGLWLYELAELANFGKSEINLIKAFISATTDRYRPSYGRIVESFDRQCVMVGTTNERTYLRDRTGNRRFWPVPVRHRIDIDWLVKHRDEMYAEAYQLHLQGEQFFPDVDVEERLFVPMQEQRLVETAVMSELLHILTRPPTSTGIGAVVNDLVPFVTLSQLTMALGVDAAKSNASLEGQIKSWMEEQGWERKKRQINGVRAWGYERPKDWPPIDTEDDGDAAGMKMPTASQPPAPSEPYHGDADDAPF
jgi:putative DNA primase/helicase